ncbi:MAG: rod-binding protein [Alphaproteobacteria bacterium]
MDNMHQDTTIALMKATQGLGDTTAKKLKENRQLEKIAGAAEEFEAVFIAEMMKPMFQGLSTEAPFGGGQAEEVFRSMLLQEYGKVIAKTGDLGIADSVKQELIKTQEQSSHE